MGHLLSLNWWDGEGGARPCRLICMRFGSGVWARSAVSVQLLCGGLSVQAFTVFCFISMSSYIR